MSDRIKTALVGFGKAGEFLHAPFIESSPFFELTKIVERTPKHAATAYPQAQIVRTFQEVLSDPAIELVVLTTPNETHAELAAQVLSAGKHVVVDKPFTVYASDAKRLLELSLKTGKHIFVYQNRRWDGDFLTVQKIIKEEVLGKIFSIESRFDRYRPEPRTTYWKESDALGNGLWYDLGPHLMDQAFHVFGQPQNYTADIKKQRKGAIGIDYVDVTFQYDQMTFTIHAGMLEKEPTPRWVIKGSKGTYVKYGVDPQEARLNAGEKPLSVDWGVEDAGQFGKIEFADGQIQTYPTLPGDYRIFYQGVSDSIRKGTQPLISLNDAVELVGWLERLSG
ncbi:Gfo/Idh/MocA family oxidoreductase [Cytophaga aurantiaca]|uniref:Gfo/Idh/MocA family oxidoreductase n=1 Tax=Cytophaga aurantiaca TaxID=29530 RepID=UPI0003641818|nr:Gfo/Idh/MocA family oxidoreductase [Cytophaga aurantiaca]